MSLRNRKCYGKIARGYGYMTLIIEMLKREGYRVIAKYADSVYMGNTREIIHFYLNDNRKWEFERI